MLNPSRAPEPLPILNPSNVVPKTGFQVVTKGLTHNFRIIVLVVHYAVGVWCVHVRGRGIVYRSARSNLTKISVSWRDVHIFCVVLSLTRIIKSVVVTGHRLSSHAGVEE